jgi:hypothetical protein
MRRKKARRNRTPMVIALSVTFSLLLLSVGIPGYFAIKRGGKAQPVGGLDLFSGGDGRKESAAGGDGGAAAQKAGWVECPDSDKTGYKLWMPQKPAFPRTNLGPVVNPLPGSLDSAFIHNDAKTKDIYYIGANRLEWVAPKAERKRLVRQIATERREAAGRDPNYKVAFGEITDFEQDGFPGCEIKFSGKEGGESGAIRYVHAGDKVFCLFVGGPGVTQDSKINTFLNSFKVTYQPDPDDDSQIPAKFNYSKVNWEPEWQLVADADGFVALMPGRATRSGTSWVWSRSGEVFEVAYHPGKSVDDLHKVLADFPHPKAAALGLKRSNTMSPFEKTEFPAREHHYNPSQLTFAAGQVRVYSVHDRTYTVAVAVHSTFSNKVPRFMKSVRFTYRPKTPK